MADQPTNTKVTQQRVIRVFISSTFRDMQAEREELVKRIFPQLRKLCESRGVTWGEVDLRWGITEEQSQRGEVLPICLAEIQRCRPYFIGLLGERYGWVPDEIPQELIEQEPWLAERLNHSVTELEILHGVRNDPTMADHAFFYFRDRSFIDSLQPDERADFLELPTAEEIAKYGRSEAERRAAERRQKLAALKDLIRASRLPVRENYPNPQALDEIVLRDLTEIIDRLYPKGSEPDSLDREALDHEAFAESRAKVYIGGGAYFGYLDEHARSNGPPLAVLGESGSGKSALLSNWALRYRSSHPEELLLMHFIGATPYSADWMAMLRRIMGEFKRQFEIQQEIPDQPDQLRAAFANWLHMAAARGRVVLILDALNQLEDRDGAPDLVWLPPVIPSNIRLIVSTLPGRPLDDLKKRGWPTLSVKPLEPDERKQVIAEYLAQYTKALSPARVEHIAAADETANPLYLRALLDELRVFGIHEKLDDRIEHYLAAATIPELYEKVLERYEADYERDRVGLVQDAMTLLWAARRGLSEAELLEMLGTDQGPLPRAHWSPLYLAAEQSLVSRSGLIGFFHDYLREAVRQRCLPDKQEQQAVHLRLADYFQGRELGSRKVDELPWQLAQGQAWDSLATLLAELPFFAAAFEANVFDVHAYWAAVERNSDLRLIDAYRHVLRDPAPHVQHVRKLSNLFNVKGHPEEVLLLEQYLVEHYRQAGERQELAAALNNLGNIAQKKGQLERAMELFREQESIARELGDKDGLQASLGNQAVVLSVRGQLDEAMELLTQKERLCRELGNKLGLATSLYNRSTLLLLRGETRGAMTLMSEAETLYRELGDRAAVALAATQQASVLQKQGRLDDALATYQAAEGLYRDLGYKAGVARAVGLQATVLYSKGDFAGSLTLHEEEERIYRELGYKGGQAISLRNQAVAWLEMGDSIKCTTLMMMAKALESEMGPEVVGTDDLLEYMTRHAVSDRSQQELARANIFYARGELDEAMRLHKETERICRELGNKDGLQRSLGNQALILQDRGELDEAMRLHKEQERICRELGNKYGLAISLINQASLLAGEMRRPREALPLAEEAYRVATSHGLTALAQQIKPILDGVRSYAR